MLRQIFSNMGPVTKNILIINVLMLLLTAVMEKQGYNLMNILGMHYFMSSSFKPFQIVTHMFMHANFMHLLGNMFGLVFFGSQLERFWGAKRFFIYYFVTGFGALTLYMGVDYFHFLQSSKGLSSEVIAFVLDDNINQLNLLLNNGEIPKSTIPQIENLIAISNTPMVGASGAIFGITTAFAMLFPNSVIQLLFPPIALKAKWFAIIYIGIELYLGLQNNPSDNVAHFAHLGGALIGFIIVKIWNKSTTNY